MVCQISGILKLIMVWHLSRSKFKNPKGLPLEKNRVFFFFKVFCRCSEPVMPEVLQEHAPEASGAREGGGFWAY